MRKLTLHFLSLLAGILSAPATGQATHVLGADITYEYMSGNQYLVQLRYYRDCAGVNAPGTVNICYYSSSCNFNASVQLYLTGPAVQMPPFPYLPNTTTSCNGGVAFGVERYIYTGVVNLPFACNDWTLGYTAPPTGMTTNGNFLVTTKIDNLNYPGNSSIRFVPDPQFQFCVMQLGYESVYAVDIDGDSIRYSLVPAMADSHFCPPQPNTPNPGSQLFQIPSSTNWYMHPTDGWFNFTPAIIALGNVTIRCDEFRNGILINQTLLSHLIGSVSNCIFTGVTEPVNNGVSVNLYPNPVTDYFEIDETGVIEVHVQSADGSFIRLFHTSEIHYSGYRFPAKEWPSGIYFVTVFTSSGIKKARLVKI